ncbi:MAG: DUF6498-containing protein [Gemmatimonadota bacterium]
MHAGERAEPPGWSSASVLALLLANLVPLLGVLGLGWDLGEIMVLFWAESGIIGFYSLLRLCYVAGWSAIFLGPFFLAHFGGFMAGHFFFIYALFIEGVEADGTVTAGADAGVLETLGDVFGPLYPALLALFLSPGDAGLGPGPPGGAQDGGRPGRTSEGAWGALKSAYGRRCLVIRRAT